jgi:branched-chain amino acid transport system permease protein
MEVFVAQLLNGLSLGSIYVLLVTGFNLMVLVARIIQFAYPHMVVLSMYACWEVLHLTNNMFLAILSCIAVSVILNILSEPIFRRLTNRESIDINASFVVSMSMALVITDIMSHSLNYGFPIAFPASWVGESLIRFGLITLSKGQIYAFGGGIIAVLIFFYLLYRTKQGRVFRAMAENRYVARLVGIPIVKTSIFSYFIAGLLGGFIAILFSMFLGSASPQLGDFVAMKVIATSLVAGLGNLKGGLVCGLLLGVAEGMVMGYISGSWSNAIAFIMMLLIVLIKPQGLFGIKI